MAPPMDSPMSAKEPLRILVVDSDPSLRLLLVIPLQQHGWEVTTVADGEAALEILQAGLPDVLLIDLILPKRSGREVLAWIDATNRSWLEHVIVLTAASHSVREDLQTIHPISGIIRKPFDIADLANRIESCAKSVVFPRREAQTANPRETVNP